LFNALELIEKNLGRIGKGKKEPRTIDLDLLLFGEQIITSETLTIPHPAILQRPFVMVPLLDIEANLVHPVTKRPVREFLKESSKAEIILYKDHVERNL
jgi:7,8-dihydro-6-hydroxymethylpterin-pyrophosphokinase